MAAVEGYPLHGTGHAAEDVWTGPESLYVAAGFAEMARGPRRVVYRLELERPAGSAAERHAAPAGRRS